MLLPVCGMFYAARPWLTKHALRAAISWPCARHFFDSKNCPARPLRGNFLAKTSHTLDRDLYFSAKTLKTVGMGKIQDFNDKALSCMFTEGFKLLKKGNIIKSRKDAKMRRERQIKLIHAAVRFFQARMKKRREQLKVCTEASQNKTYVRMKRPHEVEYRNIMKKKRAGR